MTGMRIVGLVAARELRERSRQKSFRVSTAVLALALLAAVVVPRMLADDAPASFAVGVVGAVPEAVSSTMDSLDEVTEAELSVVQVPDAGAGEVMLADGSLDVLLTEGEVVIDQEPDASSTLGRVSGALAQALGLDAALADAGMAPEVATDVLRRGPAPVRSLAAGRTEAARDDPQPVLVLGVILLYVALLTFGSAVTTGIVEEKSSRVVEVLLSTIRPHQLLAGKVLGIGVLGLAQLVMVATPAVVVAVTTGTELPSGSGLTIASLALWFVLGYALYSCAYAAAGSLVSRMEEAMNTSFPVTFGLIAAYGAAIFVGGNPHSDAARLFALFPPTAPLAMPTRAAMGGAAWWEVPLAVGLTLAATFGLVRLAGRIYAGTVLDFGPKVKLRDALRSQPVT